MIGIRKHDLRVKLKQALKGKRLHRPVGPDRHTEWGINTPVRRRDFAKAGFGIFVFFNELKHIFFTPPIEFITRVMNSPRAAVFGIYIYIQWILYWEEAGLTINLKKGHVP